MILTRMVLRNWLCFRGEHIIDLGEAAYAVTAEDEVDHERSNWLGKTAIVEAPAFALFGRHRHRQADGWITNGEPGGEVRLEFSDGFWVQRHRARGKPTTLTCGDGGWTGSREGSLKGDAAQAEILRRVGLTEQDFAASCWFEQRKMAEMVLADPSRRMEIVGGWLQLGPLEDAEERARAIVARERAALESAKATALSAEQNAERLEAQANAHQVLGPDIDYAAKAREAQAAVEEGARQVRYLTARARYSEVVAAGLQLAAEEKAAGVQANGVEAQLAVLTAERTEVAKEVGVVRRRLEVAQRVAQGDFDGACPVSQRQCPVKNEINSDRVSARRALDVVKIEDANATKRLRTIEDQESRALAATGEKRRRMERLVALREEAERLKGEAALAPKDPPDLPALRAAAEEAQRRLSESRVAASRAEQAKEEAAHHRENARAARTLAETLEKKLATAQAAVRILGRAGAQRVVAETALTEIGQGANHMLTEAGVSLRVDFSWTSEGTGPAKHCHQCGAPFPSSTRVKVCEACGAERGKHLVSRLDLDLSDRSGAAEDLAGVAIQLSAAAWLRRSRGSAWSLALIDEPFGQLDAHNRRGLANHLASLLRGRYGFAQAFVVAHQRGVLDSFPARIQIRRTGGRSEVRVSG